ncbi:hypothetical protein V3C99_010937 [Haemonchus contortus]
MHILSVIAIAFNAFAIYCILFKSTKQMGIYKWYLLAYQLSSTVFDITYMIFTLPVIFFPVPMGYAASWFARMFSISGHTAVQMVVTACLCLVASIVNLFVYRCHVIIPNYHFLKASNNGQIYATVIIFALHLLSCPVGIAGIAPDQVEAKKWCLEEYTCAKSAAFLPQLYFYTPHRLERPAIAATTVGSISGIICVTCIVMSSYFLRQNGKLSEKTRQMQRRFLLYLCIQVLIPTICMFIPIVTLMYIFGTTNDTKRDLGNFALALLGTHGCVEAVTVIMCNEPYRTFVTKPLRELWKRKEVAIVLNSAVSSSGIAHSTS